MVELILLVLALLFLVWRVKSANDEAFSVMDSKEESSSKSVFNSSGYEGTNDDSDTTIQKFSGHSWQSNTSEHFQSSWDFSDSFEHRTWGNDCDISRAMWDPSCPLYHTFHHDDWHSSSSWDNSWSSSSWDSGSSSWDSWSSSSWDS